MASLKQAVAAKCKDCTYDPHAAGSWRHQVEMCTVRACPLWEVRPMTVETINLIRKGKISAPAGIKPVEVDLDAILAGMDDEEEEVA